MAQLTPAKYWRVARTLDELQSTPPERFEWPPCLASQKEPPRAGHGVLLADYDREQQTGLIRYLGMVESTSAAVAHVRWAPVDIELWVDTPAGRGYWANQPGFAFAKAKVPGYGLHQMFASQFEGLAVRESLPNGARAANAMPRAQRGTIAPERLHPIEVVGEPSASTRGGYVYVLESAYGYKVGRTRNVPNRMRAFGVKLPIAYTVRLCAWFDDHYEAESAYHRLFGDRLINGEWFSLQEQDIDLIRGRTYGGN